MRREVMGFLLKFLEIVWSLMSWLLGRLLDWWWLLGSPSGVETSSNESGSVRELHLPTDHVDMDVIFFHGLDFGERRDAECRAWMSADGQECWPQKWLPEQFSGARILAVSYDASVLRTNTRGRMDVEVIAENLVSELILCNDVKAGQGLHCPLVLVGHSVGGLVIKQLCRHAFRTMNTCKDSPKDEFKHKRLDRFLSNLRGVFYYSTPHGGSRMTKFFRWYKTRGSIMEIMDFGSTKAAELHSEFKAIRKKYKDAWTLAGVVESHETQLPGFCGVVVDMASAKIDNDFGEHSTASDDHFSICRPRDRTTFAYQRLVNFLSVIQEQEKPVDIETISSKEKFLVGLLTRVKKIETILQTVPTLGLYGMGGVGKTTLARAVLEAYHLKFDYSCWVADLKELVERERGPRLKSCILEGLLKRGKKVSPDDADWDILKGQKVLLVIDNVDSEYQLEKAQIPWRNWFGDESRVIVTSRDKRFCQQRFKLAWKVNFLTDDQSWELFLHLAFGKEEAPSHVMNGNLKKVLKFCGGVPLAIEVVALTLHKEVDQKIWTATIQKLKEGQPADGNSDDRLLNNLRLSYDRLGPEEQKMFIDSALLLMDEPVSKAGLIWEASWGPGVPKSWKNLTFRCLVDVKMGKVWVHDALRMLARNIACPKHDDGHMRNWLVAVNAPEVAELLCDTSQEPCKAEGLIYLRKRSCRTPVGLYGERITEARFPRLRLLNLVNIQISGDAVHLPSRLVYLRWSDATRTTIPFVLRHLTRLCWLDLTECEALESIPEDVDRLTGLTRLELGGCHSLTSLPDALGKLTALTLVDVRGCRSLSSVPDGIGNLTKLVYFGANNSGLREIPDFLEKLTNLETLSLGGSLVSKLPDSMGKLKKLKVMEADNTPLVRIPPSVVSCQSLSRLDLSHTSVSNLPESFGAMKNLRDLNLSHTKLEMLPESVIELGALSTLSLDWTPLRCLPDLIGNLGQLRSLNLDETGLDELPLSITKLENLSELFMNGCKKLSCLTEGFENLRSLRDFRLIRGDEHVTSGNLPWESLMELGVDYVESWFDADGSTAEAIPQYDIAPGTSSASASQRTARGGAASDRAEREREGHLHSEPAIGASRANVRYPFKRVRMLEVAGNANIVEFPRPLLLALSHMKALEELTLREFHAVRRLPENFGDFLPNSLKCLTFDGWRSLEVLPELRALSHMKALEYLTLREFHAIRRLSEDFGDFLPSSLMHLTLDGWRSLEVLPELRALSHMKTLRQLELNEFHAVKRLSENFGDFLPNSLECLTLEGWRSLEELPESLGRVTTLKILELRCLDNLKRLPETADWPQLRSIVVEECENLRSWPARAFAGPARVVVTDSWTLLRELVEKYARQSHLRVDFWVKSEYRRALEVGLPSWTCWYAWLENSGGLGEGGCGTQYEGEGIWKAMEALAAVYEGPNGGAQRQSVPLPPAPPPVEALGAVDGGRRVGAQCQSAPVLPSSALSCPLAPPLFQFFLY